MLNCLFNQFTYKGGVTVSRFSLKYLHFWYVQFHAVVLKFYWLYKHKPYRYMLSQIKAMHAGTTICIIPIVVLLK